MNEPGPDDDGLLVHFLLIVIIFKRMRESGFFCQKVELRREVQPVTSGHQIGREKGGCEWTVLSRCIR